MEESLTKSECFAVLDRWEHWNTGQKSVSLAFGGVRTKEDDILDKRRELILNATQKLEELTRR